MKNVCLILGVLSVLYSCSNVEELPDVHPLSSGVTTRFAGDGEYDVLGFGYDVTGEYLHPLSVKSPILDIGKYEQDHKDRLIHGTSSFGFDKMYYGYSSSDYVKDITTETKATYTMNYGNEKDTSFFSADIKNNSYLKTEYSYSDKYSFASLDAVRNRKHIYINDEVSVLSQYLSDAFKNDLNRLSPDRIIERYGTHVLTDFLIGGRYKLMFRSVITKSRDASTKRETVHSGFKVSLGKMGFGYNLEQSETVNESLAKENQSKELFVLFYGGNGPSLKYNLENGMPTSVDIQSWENLVSLENACLTEIIWKETYPIYSFISDPIKKQEIKDAVDRHIKLSQLNVMELLPLYSYYHKVNADHCVTTNPNIIEDYDGWEFLRIEGYILHKQLSGAVPLYEYYYEIGRDHYITTLSDIQIKYPAYEKKALLGYVYGDVAIGVVPLYEYYSDDGGNNDHYTSTRTDIVQNYFGWVRLAHAVSGYIYPAN